ncbi:hypothetical protein O0L34_g18737 [Tuta absoluta]|nr:hypothetical protein O0L34_g18737 [Tuta absoluta]
MQTRQEDTGEKVGDLQKSLIRYPSYVVAFSMKETYDDQITECGEQRLSPNSSLPKNLNDNTDGFETAQKMISQGDTTILPEIKINIDGDDQDFTLTSQKDCRLKETEHRVKDEVNMDGLFKQPRVLFRGVKCKKRQPQRKLRYHKRYNNSKNQTSKCIDKNKRYYSDKDWTVAEIQKDLYEDCTTEVASRCRVVKNALAKENLLEATDQDGSSEINHTHLTIDSLSSTPSTEKTLSDSLSSQNNSLTSQKTLTSKSIESSSNYICSMEPQINSPSNGTLSTVKQNDLKHDYLESENDSDNSKSDDAISVHSKPSVIDAKAENLFSIQPNIINVALAVTTTSKMQKVCDEIKENLRSNSMTSVPKVDTPSAELTSRDPSSNLFDSSIETLVNPTSSIRKGSITTLTLLRNKSLSNGSGCSYALSANSVLIHNEDLLYSFLASDTLPNHVKTFSFQMEKGSTKQWTTGSRVLSAQSMHKDIKSSNNTSKDANDVRNTFEDITGATKLSNGANGAYVTKTKQRKVVVDKIRTKSRPRKSKGFMPKQKNCLHANEKHYQKSHWPNNIPNEGPLKAMKEKVKTIDDLANVPDEIRAEIWEKVSVVLDVIAHRLEHSLADKIIKEIKTLSSSQHANCEPKRSRSLKNPSKNPCNFKEKFKTDNSLYSHKSFQCNIVNNKMLDDMMLQLSMDGPKILVQPKEKTKRIDEPVLYKDFEILKSPVVKSRPEEIITVEDSSLTTTSTLAAETRMNNMLVHQRLKYALMVCLECLRENIFVMAAVPSFFVFIFLMYTLVAILAKLL